MLYIYMELGSNCQLRYSIRIKVYNDTVLMYMYLFCSMRISLWWIRYGEDAEEVGQLADWICPKCRGFCNCSLCQ